MIVAKLSVTERAFQDSVGLFQSLGKSMKDIRSQQQCGCPGNNYEALEFMQLISKD